MCEPPVDADTAAVVWRLEQAVAGLIHAVQRTFDLLAAEPAQGCTQFQIVGRPGAGTAP
jgi:hypothetical protein